MNQEKVVLLDGNSVTPEDIYEIGYNQNAKVDITKDAWKAIKEGRQFVEDLIKSDQVVYGTNTGFGNFANVVIDKQDLEKLQRNLIRSHACGVGDPMSPNRTRMLLGLRLNVLAKGHSGVRPETVQTMLDAINAWCLPYVPCQGTVGASGDLAPLSHLALGMMGEGKMWDPEEKQYKAAKDVLKKHKIQPITLGAKEGLALINGTQMITTFGCEAIVRAKNIARQADVIGALTVEALKGTVRAFHPLIHAVRPHKGQGLTAARLRSLLHREGNESEISVSHKNCGKVQDSYTLRCMPQVHGVVHDTLKFVYELIKTECNSATDNPMIFADPENDAKKYGVDPNYKMEEKSFIISGGNFHGEYPAKALDFLAIAIHELSSISERRIERLVNPTLSELPAFLVKNGGLNSGFMIAHCTAAALVSENKCLAHPSSVDSIPTSAAKEDHVSMGGWAARKALKVVEHVETVLGIELLASCQAIDLLRPLKTTPILEEVYALVRTVADEWKEDRFMQPDIEACHKLLLEQQVWNAVSGKLDQKLHRLP